MLLPLFWVASMLLLLSLVPSKRADRLFPVLPAIAILAAWTIVRQVRGVSALMRVLAVVVMVAGFALIFGVGGLQLPPIPGVGIVILGAGAAMFVPRQGVQIAALVMAMIAAMSAYQFHLRPDLRAPGGIVALDSEPELQRQLDLPRRRGLLE